MTEITAVPIRAVKRGWLVWLTLAIAAAVLTGVALAWAGTSKPVATAGSPEQFMAWHKARSGVVTTASGLQYQIVKKGAGATPSDADIALVNYKGTLRDGKPFDQGQRTPLPVTGVVPGFGEALKLMPRGSVYKIWIPPALGYGAQAMGDGVIPANSVLVFELEMLDFRNQAEVQAQMQAMQAQQALQGQPQVPGAPITPPRP